MDLLKKQWTKIREQLADLSASQKMLAGALVVIMLMTLLWWSRYAGTSETEALLEQDFQQDDIARVTSLMASRSIPYKVVGNRIHVAAERKFEVLALLGYEQLLPRDTATGFDDIIQKMDSPWNTDKKQDVVFNRAKEVTLAQVLRGFPGIRNATVLIDSTNRRAFGEQNRQPSATVNLQTKSPGEKANKRLIQAAADVVAGAVSGMQRSRVNIVVDGASYNAHDRDSDSAAGDTWMDMVKEGERYFAGKIQDHLRWIDNVMVSVTVDPKMNSSHSEKESYDKAGTFDKPIETIEKSEERTNSTKPAGEPGAVPNTGANLAANLGGGAPAVEGSNTTNTENKSRFQVFPSVVREWMKSPAGSAAVVGASVSIPRSHFVRILKASNPSARDPDDTVLQPLIDSELRKIKNVVKGCVDKAADERILVDWYYDYVPALAAAGGNGGTAAATSLPLALTSHLKEIALGVLAVISLFMVSMMVKKGAPAPIPAPRPQRQPPEPIEAGEAVAGEVGEGTQSLDAMELDDDAIKTQQMITQVSTMVKENPDGAANLVKRWLNK